MKKLFSMNLFICCKIVLAIITSDRLSSAVSDFLQTELLGGVVGGVSSSPIWSSSSGGAVLAGSTTSGVAAEVGIAGLFGFLAATLDKRSSSWKPPAPWSWLAMAALTLAFEASVLAFCKYIERLVFANLCMVLKSMSRTT